MEVFGTFPYLDFGSSTYGYDSTWVAADSEAIAVADLDRFITRISTGRAAPLVILDIAAPAGPHEQVRQLLIRNDFASQLAALGNAAIVLATGLTVSDDFQLVDDLIRNLTTGSTPAEAARGVQRLARGTWLEGLPYAGTALMSLLPPHEMLPVGI
jgi:hypothetical protein